MTTMSFWFLFFLILYSYLGFPLLVILRSFFRKKQSDTFSPVPQRAKVSIIIAAYNEEAVIRQKLDNTFAIEYPSEDIEVIVASDGSDDGTEEVVKNYAGGEVNLLCLPRQGKNQTLNKAVSASSGEILVFTDADTMLMPDALQFLLAPFSDPQIGGVAGNYDPSNKAEKGANERDFLSLEKMLKLLQSRIGSVTSAWGPIYAIRRSVYAPVPSGVTDDFFLSVQPMIHHKRLLFEPLARAVGPVADSSKVEFRRKVRIISAGLKSVWHTRVLLNPLKYGFLALQIFSHKVLRRLMGVPLSLLLVLSFSLWRSHLFYAMMVIVQVFFHSLAFFGFLFQETKLGRARIFRLPFFGSGRVEVMI